MKLSGLTVLVLVLVLSGCTTAPTLTAVPAAEPTYLELMRDTKAFFGASDAQLVTIGESVCAALEDGSTFDDAAEALQIGGITADEAESVIFASADEFCPAEAG